MTIHRHTSVIIIGAGVTGISAAYYLSKSDIQHVLLEQTAEVGGIWSAQRWPGIRCDTDIIKYSYSFKPFLAKQRLVSGEAISRYLHATSKEFKITDKIVFGAKVERAVFDTEHTVWHVYTTQGRFSSQFLINANGYFAVAPHIPTFEGSEDFKGDITHLLHLDPAKNMTNKRVVLVGSGASAICAAPVLCAKSLSTTLLQRSPSYIYEENNNIGMCVEIAQRLYAIGLTFPVKVISYWLQCKDDIIFVVFRKWPWIGKLMFRMHWKDSMDRKTYRDKFTPTYNPWEQRIPVALGLKDIIKTNKLHVVKGAIKSFSETGIVLEDGRTIDADLCVLATGYDMSLFKFDIWLDDQKVDTQDINYYKGMMFGGIPNYFQPIGAPHTSWTRRIEVISKLIVKIILYMQKRKLDTVAIDRKTVNKCPKITPNYVMRSLSKLPAIYGTLELPSIDNVVCYVFRKRNFTFSGGALPKERGGIAL